MFERVGVPVIGVAENMSYFVCPHCGERTEVFRAGGGQRLADELGVPLVGRVPLQAGVSGLADAGRPVVVPGPAPPPGGAPRGMAGRLVQPPPGPSAPPGPAAPPPRSCRHPTRRPAP